MEAALPGTLEEAIAQLRKDPMRPVRAEVDGLTVEVRRVETPPAAGTSAADVFREIGPWEGESDQEIRTILAGPVKVSASISPRDARL